MEHVNTDVIEDYIAKNPNRATELANKIGIAPSTLNLIRRGYQPSKPVIKSLARELKVDEETLLFSSHTQKRSAK